MLIILVALFCQKYIFSIQNATNHWIKYLYAERQTELPVSPVALEMLTLKTATQHNYRMIYIHVNVDN